MTRVLVIGAVFTLVSSLLAQDSDAIYASANTDFEEGDYASAIESYSKLATKGLVSPDLFYNLGTSLYREGNPGEALLWLRRALVAQPGMPEAAQNLEFLRNRIGFLEFADSKIDQSLRTLPPTFGKWLFWSAFWMGLIALAAAFCIDQLRPNRSGLITLAIALLMISFVGNRIDRYSKLHLSLENFATITAEDVSALTSPTPDAESVIELPPGSEVRILQVADRWIYVSIPGDLRGWIRRDQLEQVWPIIATTS